MPEQECEDPHWRHNICLFSTVCSQSQLMGQNEHQQQDSEQDHMLGPRPRMRSGVDDAEPKSGRKTEDRVWGLMGGRNGPRRSCSAASGDENFQLRCRSVVWLPQRKLFVNMACPGVRRPEGSSQLSISLIKNRRARARLRYRLLRNYCKPPGAHL